MTRRQRFSDNSVLQLTLGVHLALLVLLAAVHRLLWNNHWYGGPPYGTYRLMTGLCAGLFLAQVCLISFWAAFSGRSTALRGAALLLIVPLLVAVQSQVFNETNYFVWWFTNWEDSRMRYTTWVVELTLSGLIVATCGMGLRLAGFRMQSPDQRASEPTWTCRLVDLGGWFVVLSLAFAAGHWLRDYGWSWHLPRLAWEWSDDGYFLSKGEIVFLGLLLATGFLWPKSPRWGVALIFLLPLAFSLFDEWRMGPLDPGEGPSTFYFHRKVFTHNTLALMYCVLCLVFGGTLLVVRDRGYRLIWRNPLATKRKPDA